MPIALLRTFAQSCGLLPVLSSNAVRLFGALEAADPAYMFHTNDECHTPDKSMAQFYSFVLMLL